MNALTPTGGSNATLIPQTLDQAIRLADLMSRGKIAIPDHLRGDPASCLAIIEQAQRWNMSPFAVAACTSNIKGRMMFEGKLVAAAVEYSGAIDGGFDYQFSGSGMDRKIVVSARRNGETGIRSIEVVLKDAITDNGIWKKQPDQQLVYYGTRAWARRWTPGVMLGVYSPEEFDSAGKAAFDGTTIDGTVDPVEVHIAESKTQTIGQWLDELDIELRDAGSDGDAVDAILARDRVQKAQDHLTNGARERLNAMIQAALGRCSAAETSAPVDEAAEAY